MANKVYGDKAKHGTSVQTEEAKSDAMGTFKFSFYVPRDVDELAELVTGPQGGDILTLVKGHLETKARGAAWQDERKAAGLNTLVEVTLTDGKTVKVSQAAAETLKAAGLTK